MNIELQQKQQKYNALKLELVKMKAVTVDKSDVKKLKTLNAKLDFVQSKYQQVLVYRSTLKHMIDRDLKNSLRLVLSF